MTRRELFEEYYKTREVDEYTSFIKRTMTLYDRDMEAEAVRDCVEDVSTVLDFGCGVGDYGIIMARDGKDVTFYDYKGMLDFARYRMEQEGLKGSYYEVPTSYGKLLSGMDLVIFGEVLEHLDNPKSLLEMCLGFDIVVVTSSYPYVSDKYFELEGHTDGAKEQRLECKLLLEGNYTVEKPNGGELKVWTKI